MPSRATAIAFVSAIFALLAASGCAPADVAGDYTVAVTNGENGCMVDGWTVGESNTSIPVLITQDEGVVQVTVMGVAGISLNLLVGSNLFNGDVGGNTITADLIGDNTGRQGECAYTYTVEMDASVDGDLIEGTLTWRPVTNGHPDCGILATCRNSQSFNGTRPPPG